VHRVLKVLQFLVFRDLKASRVPKAFKELLVFRD
jgi:hypothetical protein